MKKCIIVAALALIMGAQAQPPARGGGRRPVRSLNFGNWVGRHFSNPEFVKELGLDEAQQQRIKESNERIDQKLQESNRQIEALALEQAEIAKKLLLEPGVPVDPLMEKIEAIGKLRTEQAKLSTQAMVDIRDILTAEQNLKARELVMAEGRKRFEQRGGRDAQRPGAQNRPNRPDRPERPNRPNRPERAPAPKGW